VLGDESGTLEQCLRLLADYWAGEHRMMLRVRQRLTYPIIQMFAAAVIAPLPLVFAGAVPAYVLTAAGGVALVAAAGGSVLLAAARRYGRQPRFVRARLLRAITIAIEAGLPLARAVELAAAASDDSAVIAHLAGIPLRTMATQPLARTFAGCPGIPREMVAAMEVADATGDYGGTLRKLADLYEG
jgi:type II secretory pathway component PulF